MLNYNSYRNYNTNFLEFDIVSQYMALGVRPDHCLKRAERIVICTMQENLKEYRDSPDNSNLIAFLPLSLQAEVVSNVVQYLNLSLADSIEERLK